METSPNLKPYTVLEQTVGILFKENEGRQLTANYGDIGIHIPKKKFTLDNGTVIYRDRYFLTNAINLDGTPWIIGALARNFFTRDDHSYIYGFKYNWQKIFERARVGSTPRFMPPRGYNSDFDMIEFFSASSAFINNEGGVITPVENDNREFVNSQELTEVVKAEIRLDHGAMAYTPKTPQLLANILTAALLKKQRSEQRHSE